MGLWMHCMWWECSFKFRVQPSEPNTLTAEQQLGALNYNYGGDYGGL